ncbi:hypothetical protein COCOBI_09-5960 [Coccomyxa sp. Obi]|nr:hypothetical protein COCOBI_09-5960 [Coccomyxa sp. Obi]
MKSLIHKIKDKTHELKDKTREMRDDKGSQPTEFPRTGLQPGFDQTEAGTAKDPHHSMGSEAAVNKPGSGISGNTGAAGREQLAPKDPIVHIRSSDVPKVPMAQPRATETKPQDVIAPSPHGTTNLGGVDNPKDAGYAPLREGVSSTPASATGTMGGYTSQGKGFPDSKPAVTDVGLSPDTSKIGSKPDTSKIGAATKGHLEQTEPLLAHKAHENKAVHGTGMGLPNSAQDTGFNSSKPSSTSTTTAPDISKIAAKFDTAPGTYSDNAGALSQKAKDNKAAHGTGMGLPTSVEDTASKGTTGKATDFTFDKIERIGGDKTSTTSKDHSDSSSKRSDYTSALDKIAGESADTANWTAENTKGVAATAAEYVSSGARTVAQKAKEVHESVNDGTASDKAKATGQAASDKAQAAKDTVVDTAAKGTQNVQDAVKPYADAAADKTKAALDSVQEKAGVAGRDDMTVFQKAQAIVQTAAAATAEKASQVYETVAQKVHETGVPQAAQEHAATARDTVANTAAQARDTAVEQAAAAREAAAQKYDELSAEAQRHKDAGLKALDQGKLKAQEHAQLAADMANRKAAELAHNMREASVDDVNRSWLGRTTGGIVLVALASYALGVPFRYGLAAALFALAAVLFADWDRSRSVGGRRSPLLSTTTQPKTVHVRPATVVQSTEFGVVKADAGRIEEGPLGGHRFVKKEERLDEKPLSATTVRYAKEE